ncbi:hypothetical protein [Streptomyces sp. NPDC056817]|uniref:hypothetical protein n=1 Tax=Streptomyces sp. NPDC056817 TaxID=3345950 RepID=UPI0036A2324B
MSSLLELLRAAGLLTGLPLSEADGLAALSAVAGSAPPGTFDVAVAAGSVTGRIHGSSAVGSATDAHLVLPLRGAAFSAAVAGAHLDISVVDDLDLTIDITAAGVRWSLPRPVELKVGPSNLTLPGPVPVTMEIATVTMAVEHGSPTLVVSGMLHLDNIPSSLGRLSTPFEVRSDRHGFSGALRQAGPVALTLGWSQAQDPFPSSIDITNPFSVPDISGILDAAVNAGDARVRTRLVRTSGGYAATVAVESGDHGIVSSNDRRIAALAVLATAAAADTQPADGRPTAELVPLLATAALLGAALRGTGRARVTAVRFDSATRQARIDYDADLSCAIDTEILKARTTSPMHVAVRNALLEYGSGPPTLGFVGASIDVSDAGRWEVSQPTGLLQVAGVRSGHGSSFFELDLRVAADCGPLKVTGAVLRISLDGGVQVSLQGFSLGVDVPELVSGQGWLAFDSAGGFAAALRIDVKPLNLRASAGLVVEKASDGKHGFHSMFADLAVDLPAPLPLANTGLGLFGVQAILGLNRSTRVQGDLKERLSWQPDQAHTSSAWDAQVFGAGVAIGTLPDLGFAFSALGRVVVRSPDVAVVTALDARLLSAPRGVAEPPSTERGTGLLGLLVVDPVTELYAGATGNYQFPQGTDWALMDAEVPVEAVYPIQQHDKWFVHLGTDGKRGGCGPIRARVLPKLFNVGADAFLMLHGDGFHPPLDLPQTPASGFAAAAGFSFSTQFGRPPVWADLSVGALLAVGTQPLFVAGRATAHGALHLGPFSLGLNTNLHLQLGPGRTRYAELKACGTIDLWFTEMSGCVHIGFGSAQRPQLDMPADPLFSATVADHQGIASMAQGALTTAPKGAPIMWPDGTVLLGFAPGPLYAGPATDPFHDALDQTSAVKGPGTVAAPTGTTGSPHYPARWSLTGLSLHQLTDAGATLITEPLPARWQLPPGLPPTTPTTGRVLALFTRNAALWSLSLLDGGKHDPANPVTTHQRGCRQAWVPVAGWAVGGWAVASGDGWDLPPLDDRPSTVSTVRAKVTTSVSAVDPLGEVPAAVAFTHLLPPAATLVNGSALARDPFPVDGLPAFPGVLLLADLVTHPEFDDRQAVTTVSTATPLEPLSRSGAEPTLVLWAEQALVEGEGFQWRAAEVWSDSAQGPVRWRLAHEQPADYGGSVGVFVWPADEAVSCARIRHPRLRASDRSAHAMLGVVAIGGITTESLTAANDANASGAAADTDAHAASTAQPADSPFVEGATYRLDITWSGSLDGDPRPAVGGTNARHFRIAKHAASAPTPQELYRSVTVFHPAMLGRYLAGYTVRPDVPWFLDDPITATFSSRTIKPVAELYGYDVSIAVHRTDPPPGWAQHNDPRLKQLFALQFTSSMHYERLEPVDRLGITLLEPECCWPRDATDVEVRPNLQPDAWYEVGVLLRPTQPHRPHRVETTLPPASFRTSHWRSPRDLFRSFGFDHPEPEVLHVGLRAAVVDPGEDSDGALHRVLLNAGVALGPLDVPTRTTVFWAPDGDGDYVVTAVLLEAMEPLMRAERLGAATLAGFTTRTDSRATSLLFVADSPVRGGPLTLTWPEHYSAFKETWLNEQTATLVVPTPTELPALAWEVWP